MPFRPQQCATDCQLLTSAHMQLLDWKEAGAMDALGPATMLLMAAGVAACVYLLG